MAEDLPSGEHSVCPRCGTSADDHVWCAGCGLNLRQRGELPTADAYAANVREQQWLARQEEESQAAAQQQQEDERQATEHARRQAAEREQERRRQEDHEAERAAAARSTQAAAEPSGPQQRTRRTWVVAAAMASLALAGGAGALLLTSNGTDADPAGPAAETHATSAAPAPETTRSQPTPAPAAETYFTDDNGRQQEPTALLFGKSEASGLEWSDWGQETAHATGDFKEVNCEPSCAEGTVDESKARITLTGMTECDGVQQYTTGTLQLTYPDGETFRGPLHSSACAPADAGGDAP